ncbi:MAG: exodeoxyribonuclease III [Bacteroidetes bacterium]|nr:exodeoxyribonuclease III [Bacteroidota bacterium]MSP57814.1 exodeoxyribonuclease III [Flavobacteriaceae bacterium]
MKVLSYNVNGIRSAMSKGLVNYLAEQNADIVCFQELKAMPEQIDEVPLLALGYQCYWFSAQKKGYSGVGILSKKTPLNVVRGCNHELFDFEGRIIRLDFTWGSVMSAYFPSGSSGELRQTVKMDFLEYFYDFSARIRIEKAELIVCGDYNICHRSMDIHDPVGNKLSSGFLPEERAWMDKWFDSGYTDSLRILHPEPHQYTWWSFRANARNTNKGWRIDYVSATPGMAAQLKESGIDSYAKHSDHCPTWALFG